MRLAFLSTFALFLLPGCPGPSTNDAGGELDTPSTVDAPSTDDTPSPLDTPAADDTPAVVDAPSTSDVPALVDAPTDMDGGSACGVAPIPDHTAGVCDGRGMAGCTRWAQDLDPDAVALCVPPEGRCARADDCTDAGCTCGGGPECGDDQLCVGRPGGAFACECLPGSSTCTSTPVPDFVSGVCDGIGRMGCTSWAQDLGGSMAVAQCVPPEGRCARADACGAAGCTCGGGPECADNEVCVGGIAGFSCICIP